MHGPHNQAKMRECVLNKQTWIDMQTLRVKG